MTKMTKRPIHYLVFGRNGEGRVLPVEDRLSLALARFLQHTDEQPVELVVNATEQEAAEEVLKNMTTTDMLDALKKFYSDPPYTDDQMTALTAFLSGLPIRTSGGCLVPEVWIGVEEECRC